MLELARRLAVDDGLNVLITCPTALPLPDGVLQDTPPPDTQPMPKPFCSIGARNWLSLAMANCAPLCCTRQRNKPFR